MLRKCLVALLAFALSDVALADEPKEPAAKPSATAVKLSDAELDQVHAGAFTLLILNNPGTESVSGFVQHHFDLVSGGAAPGDVSGLHIVVTPSDHVIVRCIVRCP
jgi:hypothetical protein